MADLTELTSAQMVKIAGSDSTGSEQTPVQSTVNGGLHVNLRDNSGNEITSLVSTHLDVSASGSITALDSATTTLPGANSQNFYFGTPTTNSVVVAALTGIENCLVQLGGIFTGNIAVEVSNDGGTNYFRPNVTQIGLNNSTNVFTAPFSAIVNTAGMTHVRARAVTTWSGSGTITIKETINTTNLVSVVSSALPLGASTSALQTTGNSSLSTIVTNVSTAANQATEITALQILDDVPTVQNGALVKGTPIMGQLDDASTTAATEDNIAAIRITAQRASHVNLRNNAGTEFGTLTTPIYASPVNYTSYSASATYAVAATPTDVFTITGSAGKIVYITKVTITGTTSAIAGITTNVTLVKRSALDTGGTSTTITAGPYLTGAAATGATAKNYTANPTALGAAVFAIKAQRYTFAVAGNQITPLIWEFDSSNLTRCPSLSSTTENMAINFGGTTITGSAIAIDIEWIEV